MADSDRDEGLQITADDALPGAVGRPTIDGLPDGYIYGVARYADVILQGAFPERLEEIVRSLERFRISLDELRAGGGGRTVFVGRFDQSLREQPVAGYPVWGKRNITIVKQLGFGDDVREVVRVRGHEIDMFGRVAPIHATTSPAWQWRWSGTTRIPSLTGI